jgi:hypothetical protein
LSHLSPSPLDAAEVILSRAPSPAAQRIFGLMPTRGSSAHSSRNRARLSAVLFSRTGEAKFAFSVVGPPVKLRPVYGQRQRTVDGIEPEPSPPIRTVLLRPRQSAVLGLSLSNWCRKEIPSVLQIRFLGGGEIALRNPGVPPCLLPGRPTVIGMEPFARVPPA